MFVYKYVVRLNVSVEDILLAQIIKAFQDLPHDIEFIYFLNALVIEDVEDLKQKLKLDAEVETGWVFFAIYEEYVFWFYYVLVVEVLEESYFSEMIEFESSVGLDELGELFNYGDFLHCVVAHEVDFAVASLSNELDFGVVGLKRLLINHY